MRERTIWKYEFPVVGEFTLQLPHEAKIIYVGVQYGKPHMWVLVDPTEELTEYQFIVKGTGRPILTDMCLSHIGTFQLDDIDGGILVLHVFEVYEIPF